MQQNIYPLYVKHISYVIYFCHQCNDRKVLYIWQTLVLCHPTIVSVSLCRSQISYKTFVRRVHNEHGPLCVLEAFAMFFCSEWKTQKQMGLNITRSPVAATCRAKMIEGTLIKGTSRRWMYMFVVHV